MTVKQGEIYWVFAQDLDIAGHEQQKSRPYVIVSRDAVNRANDKVAVGVPLTSNLNKANSHRVLLPQDHMTKDIGCVRDLHTSVALTDHIRVLDPSRFEQPKMGRLSDTAIGAIELGLVFLFDIR